MNYQDIDITKFLPHREPFLMVDNVLSINDEHVATSFTIKDDCIFNDNGVFNEAGMTENAAQTCSSIVGKSYFEDGDINGEGAKLIGFISAIKTLKINKSPKVGSTIKTYAKIISKLETEHYKMCSIQCSMTLDNEELLSCEMNLFIRELN
jgi:3-hydroxymyristoyl/3-hydroxydecanoyl-(acyl carrier protein) dehydratase